MRSLKSLALALRYSTWLRLLWVSPTFVTLVASLTLNRPHVTVVLCAATCLYGLAMVWKLVQWTSYVGTMLTVAAGLHALLYGLPDATDWWILAVQTAAWPVCFWLHWQWRLDARAAAMLSLATTEGLSPMGRATAWYIGRPSLRDLWLQRGVSLDTMRRADRLLMELLDDRERREIMMRIRVQDAEQRLDLSDE